MKTVLHIIDTIGPGGAEEVFSQLAQGLNDAEYRSIALVRGSGWVRDNLVRFGVPHFVKDCKGSFNVSFLIYLLSLIRREKVDLIHSHLLGSNVYASVAGGLLNIPVVATFHGKVDIRPEERSLKAKLFLVAFLSRKIVCVSESLRDYLLIQSPHQTDSVAVIKNGVKAPTVSRVKNSSEFAGNASTNTILLGALGNIREAKAYHIFVNAVAILVRRGFRVTAEVAGGRQGPLLNRLQAEVENHELSQAFKFIGFTDQPDFFLAKLDYYVLCSCSEGHPLALSQAMMLGIPIITTRCGVEDILEHGVDSWIVEKDDPLALAEGISSVMSRADKGASLGKAAKKKAREMFSLEMMINAYQLEYRSLLAS